jgi:hypothetical protein
VENWWLVVGEPKANTLLAIKRVPLGRQARATVEFPAPAGDGAHALTLYFMCDSYLGCDQVRLQRAVLVDARVCGAVSWPARAGAGLCGSTCQLALQLCDCLSAAGANMSMLCTCGINTTLVAMPMPAAVPSSLIVQRVR